MAPPPAQQAPAAADDDAPSSLKSALLIIGGLLLFAVAAIVLFRYLLRRWAAPSSSSAEAEGAAAGREETQAGEAARSAAAAGREPVEAVAAASRVAEAVGRAEARSATGRVEVEEDRRREAATDAAAAGDDEDTELLIASLPSFTLASALAALPKNSPDCAVCLSAFEPDAWLRLLPACRHAFHAACIDTWLRTSLACPICRAAVSSPLPPLPSAGQEPLGGDLRPRGSRRSFRVELGSVSNRRLSCSGAAGGDEDGGSWRRTYSLGGSFDYRVDEEVEAIVSRIVRRPTTAARPRPSAPAAPGEAVAEAVGSRGWLGEYLDRVTASASSLSGRWSGRLSLGRRSHSRRHDVSWRWDPESAAAAGKSATPPAATPPGDEARGMGEFRGRDNLASSASTLSGRWSWRWSMGRHGDRRGESWRWDPEAACGAPPPREEEEREPALVALGRWILGF
ncbi:unnamed protein product [Urochloa humidicola]